MADGTIYSSDDFVSMPPLDDLLDITERVSLHTGSFEYIRDATEAAYALLTDTTLDPHVIRRAREIISNTTYPYLGRVIVKLVQDACEHFPNIALKDKKRFPTIESIADRVRSILSKK